MARCGRRVRSQSRARPGRGGALPRSPRTRSRWRARRRSPGAASPSRGALRCRRSAGSTSTTTAPERRWRKRARSCPASAGRDVGDGVRELAFPAEHGDAHVALVPLLREELERSAHGSGERTVRDAERDRASEESRPCALGTEGLRAEPDLDDRRRHERPDDDRHEAERGESDADARTDGAECAEQRAAGQQHTGDSHEEERVRHRAPEQVTDRDALLHAPRSSELAVERAREPRGEERAGTAVEVPPCGECFRSSAQLGRTDDRRRVARQRPEEQRDHERHDDGKGQRGRDAHERTDPPTSHSRQSSVVNRATSAGVVVRSSPVLWFPACDGSARAAP